MVVLLSAYSYSLLTFHLRQFVGFSEVEHRLRIVECHCQRNKGASNKTGSGFPPDFSFVLEVAMVMRGDIWQNMPCLAFGRWREKDQ